MTPTQPGFYYYRHPGAPREHVWTAQVSRVRSGGLFATVFASQVKHRVEHHPIEFFKGQWFGPLPSPEEMGA